MVTAIVTALIAAVSGYVAALLQSWLERRGKIDDGLLTKRTELYKELWLMTGNLPLYPPNRVFSGNDAAELMQELRDWYFGKFGGLYMSDRTQKLYLAFQAALDGVTKAADAPIGDGAYVRVRSAGSALRSGMTRDLHSRNAVFDIQIG